MKNLLNYSPSQNVKNGYSSIRTNEYTDCSGTYSRLEPVLKQNKTKIVHVLKHWRTGEITASLGFGGWMTTQYYPLNNLPNFIKRHIDFNELEKFKSYIENKEYSKYSSGFYCKNGKVLKDA